MKYYVVETIEDGDIVVRATSKSELLNYLDEITISWLSIKSLSDYANENLGRGGIGIITNR